MFHHYVRKWEENVLARWSNFMSLIQRRTSMTTFIESQLSYCSLVWMFHDRIVNKKINHLHERALLIFYKYYISSFEDLLKRDKFIYLFIYLSTILLLIGVNSLIIFNVFMTQ